MACSPDFSEDFQNAQRQQVAITPAITSRQDSILWGRQNVKKSGAGAATLHLPGAYRNRPVVLQKLSYQ